MNLFSDFSFFIVLAAASVPAVVLGIRERPLKYYTFCVTLLMVYLAMYKHPIAMLHVALFCILEFIAA